MKTPARTTLPVNPRERQVHALKHGIFYRFAFYAFFCLFVCGVFSLCWDCWIFYSNPPAPEGTFLLVVGLMTCILYLALMIPVGDIYFYERYVEIRYLLPFMKRQVIYYDKMHVHITEGLDIVTLNHSLIFPNCADAPCTWLRTYCSEGIYFYLFNNQPVQRFYHLLLEADPEILEFVKTKAQSVNYHNGKNSIWAKKIF